ncbi:MAG: hypothetical protein K2H38_07700 [Muribaculaceae bacterium]|nr:hypothetical protein [Muribaculaceae bacterium]
MEMYRADLCNLSAEFGRLRRDSSRRYKCLLLGRRHCTAQGGCVRFSSPTLRFNDALRTHPRRLVHWRSLGLPDLSKEQARYFSRFLNIKD